MNLEIVWRSGHTVVESAANGRKAKRKDGLSGRGNWDSGCFGIDGLDEEPAVWGVAARSACV